MILSPSSGAVSRKRHVAGDYVDRRNASEDSGRLSQCSSTAQQKVPSGHLTTGDMRSFEMGKKYDVVQCLFSSIGSLTSAKDVISALRRFSEHRTPPPDAYSALTDGLTASRLWALLLDVAEPDAAPARRRRVRQEATTI